jgi:hypothetical protein
MPDGGHGHVDAPPSPAGLVQGRPHEGQAAPLAGQPADHFDPPAGLPEGPLDEVGVADPPPVLGGEPEVRSAVIEVLHQARHGRGEELPPPGGKRSCPSGGLGHCRIAGGRFDVVEDRPVLRLDLLLVSRVKILGQFSPRIGVIQRPLEVAPERCPEAERLVRDLVVEWRNASAWPPRFRAGRGRADAEQLVPAGRSPDSRRRPI